MLLLPISSVFSYVHMFILIRMFVCMYVSSISGGNKDYYFYYT